jgi:two-component system chemotaxis response regulator CheY
MRPTDTPFKIRHRDNIIQRKIEWLNLEETKMTINSKSHILVVDDSGAVRSIVRKLLTQLGYIDIDEASDGTVALAKMNEKPYGLVISDWNMDR